MERKQELRSRLLTWRRQLSPGLRAEWSKQILQRLVAWPLYREVHTIHCFRSMESMGEVDTDPLIQQMWLDGKRVVVPRTEDAELISVVVTPETEWKRHPLGMMEPTGVQVVPPEEVEMVLVPLLAADRRGHRLGYGKGMYDRFLSTVRSVKVGLLYSSLLQEEWLPIEDHDIPLDWIVTEQSILKCGATNES